MSVTLSRRVVLAGVAVAAVVVLTVVLSGGSDDGGPGVRLSTPSYVADPVPAPKTLATKDLPGRCGVSKATLRRYAPNADKIGNGGDGGCTWYSQNNGKSKCPGFCPAGNGDTDRELEAVITPGESTGNGSPDGEALRVMDPADADLIAAGDPARPVGGLGDEALYHYSAGLDKRYTPDVTTDVDTGGALLRFRTGAIIVTVSYSGRDFSDTGPVRQVAEKQARPAVLAAATDIAKALKAPAKPALAAGSTVVPPPAAQTVRPCELVPDDLVKTLAAGATRERPQGSVANPPPPYGQAVDSCEWDAEPTCCLHEDSDHRPERHLTVTVYTESEWRRGMAAAQATRLYLERHDDARAADRPDFHAVRGLGDQAFAAYGALQQPYGVTGGEAAFRYRDVVVDVGYSGARDSSVTPDEHPLDERTAVNGAYTAATAILEALR